MHKLAIQLKDAGLADLLIAAGYRTPTSIREASDRELQAIRGIGPATLGKIRERFPAR